jgi:hypothetical protein
MWGSNNVDLIEPEQNSGHQGLGSVREGGKEGGRAWGATIRWEQAAWAARATMYIPRQQQGLNVLNTQK